MASALIIGTGVAIPPNEVSNDDLARIMDTSDEWIRSRSGVVSRRFVDPGVGTSDLAAEACRNAMDRAAVDAHSIDVVITCTMTPDLTNPGIAGRSTTSASSARGSSTGSISQTR